MSHKHRGTFVQERERTAFEHSPRGRATSKLHDMYREDRLRGSGAKGAGGKLSLAAHRPCCASREITAMHAPARRAKWRRRMPSERATIDAMVDPRCQAAVGAIHTGEVSCQPPRTGRAWLAAPCVSHARESRYGYHERRRASSHSCSRSVPCWVPGAVNSNSTRGSQEPSRRAALATAAPRWRNQKHEGKAAQSKLRWGLEASNAFHSTPRLIS